MKPCILIPHYRHEVQLPSVMARVAPFGVPVIVVDDGSPPEIYERVKAAVKAWPDSRIERLPRNLGKGAAVMHGLKVAAEFGFTHAVQLDADGQHDITQIPSLLRIAISQPDALISGFPVFDESVPRARLKGRQVSIFWVRIHTWSRAIVDPLCGLRVYPVDRTLALVGGRHTGMRMEFDSEILVRAHWASVPIVFHPVGVTYPKDGLSNFHLVKDNIRISWMHTRLFFGMLLRAPMLLLRLLRLNPST